jgi:hypothetical protein
VLVILESWRDDVAGEPYTAQDLGMLLLMLEEGSTVRPAAPVSQYGAGTEPPHVGEGEA